MFSQKTMGSKIDVFTTYSLLQTRPRRHRRPRISKHRLKQPRAPTHPYPLNPNSLLLPAPTLPISILPISSLKALRSSPLPSSNGTFAGIGGGTRDTVPYAAFPASPAMGLGKDKECGLDDGAGAGSLRSLFRVTAKAVGLVCREENEEVARGLVEW